ncbi:mucus-binding protein [Streptococcus agalactiae LMG 14747]|uniref:Mucus-binding protein n=1 Tax=Streptococcus agalactiae LMG 14747 TaxID=1154860 RepID=V6Z499_STRAG|nr:mucus-binding protein [Streptococcus agalactiae LMG 14747]
MREKKSFDWYSTRQKFSIRKYHFGATSVLLGTVLALGLGAQSAQAAETTVSTSDQTVAITADSRATSDSEVAPVETSESAIATSTADSTSASTATSESATVTSTADSTSASTETSDSATDTSTVDSKSASTADSTASSTEAVASTETTATTETAVAPVERTAQVAYKVVQTDVETNTSYKVGQVMYASVPTTDSVASTEVSYTIDPSQVRSGYELAAGQSSTITQTIVEGQNSTNILSFSIVKKKEELVGSPTTAEATASGDGFTGFRATTTPTDSDLKVGDGTGVLIETGTTATPSMDDAYGADVNPHTLRKGISATSQTGWYTFESYDFKSYNDNQPTTIINGAPIDAYIRYSLDENANTSTILAELVSTANGEVLETHTIEAGASVTLSYPQKVHPNNEVVTIKYDETLAIDGSTQGSLELLGSLTGKYTTIIVPDYQVNVTKYVVENANTVLATYSLQTIGGQPVTSSDKREFAGYTHTTTTKEAVQGGLPVGTVYLAGKVNDNTLNYKAIRKVVANNQVITEYYFLDPTYTGTVDWTGIDTTGFIKLLETSPLVYTDGLTYDYNKNSTIFADHTLDPTTGLMIFKESQANDQGSKYRVVAQWSGGDTEGTYGRIFIGTQVYTTGKGESEFKWRSGLGGDAFDNKGFVPAGTQQNLRNAAVATAYETTHWYTPIPQIAQIIYQTEDGTQLDGIDTATGNPGELINYSTTNRINAYKLAGYELVSDGGPQSGQDATYDYTNDDETDPSQKFYVVLKERVVDVPKDVVPGQPVDPADPNSPVWPDSVKDLVTTKEVTRTITYVNERGDEVATTFKDKVTFTRTAQVNLLTDKITYGAWTADNADNVLDGNVLPEVPGYTATTATKDGADVTPESTTVYAQVTADNADIVEKVVYVQDTQTAKITISTVDASGGNKTEYATVNETGKHTEPVATTTVEEKLLELKRKGYDVETKVTDTFLDSAKTFDNVKDAADQPSQLYEIVVKERMVDVPKDVVPGQPVDPTDPNSPKWPESVKDLVTTEEVTRTIKYVYEDGTEAFATVTETKDFTRTASINLVTGVITYDEWTPAQDFEAVTSPTLADHLVDTPVVTGQDVNPTDPDINVTVVYTPLGSWVPVVPPGFPDVPETVYPVDPTDPTKPGTEVPTIPYIPGLVPVGPDGETPLKPTDPTDPTKGYEVPPVPEDPTIDTPITYVLADQKATVNYVDEAGNPLVDPAQLTGKSGEAIDYSTTPTIEDLLKKGYELVEDGFPTDATYDKDAAVDQVYTVVLKEKVIPVDPTDPNTPTPKPGEPVDPTDPNSPVWPDTVKDLVTKEEVTRTITYVDKDGETVFETVTETKEFTRTAEINLVTGVITYGEWTPVQTFEDVTSPLLADHLVDTPVVTGQDVNPTDPDINVTVVYTPLGSWVPVVPPGFPEVPDMVYPVDPEDPTKPDTEVPTVPHIPGTTPVTPDPENPGSFIPLTPVDPEDPSKGYVVPPVPTDPTKDTPIVYVEDNKQLASVTIVDESTGNTISTFFEQGKPGFTVGINTDEKLAELIKAGYTVTSDDYNDSAKVYDKDDNVDQAWTITVTPRIEPVDPTDPNTPTPVPGQPVDPTDPNSPVWPDSVKDLVTTQEVVRTITYVNEAGETVATDVVQKVNFTRTAQVNLVTGEITYGEWTPAQELPAVSSPVVAGYYTETPLVDPATVNAEDADITVPVVYKKLGNWIPNIPGEPVNPLPYPNDPENPTVPGTDLPVIPYVPGHTPEDPNGNPLTPVDPEDPTKGYIPPTPENPGVDTPINYTPNAVQLTVKYVDEDGNELALTETSTVKVGDDYTTFAKVIDGYYLVAVPDNQNGKVGAEGTTVIYVYNKIGSWIPQIPGLPDNFRPEIPYPVDPNNPYVPVVPTPGTVIPHVPGYVPVDPNTNEPLKPVDPEDPSKGYIPPVPSNPGVDTYIPYVPVDEPSQPVDPGTPEDPSQPGLPTSPAEPGKPVTPVTPAQPTYVEEALPNTGEEGSASAVAMGAAMLLASLGLAGKRRKKGE